MHVALSIGAVLAIAWFFMRWKRNTINQIVTKNKTHSILFDRGKIDALDKLASVSIFFLTVIELMNITGRSMNTLIAFGGIGGLALAIASQEIIGNFFGGLMIYLTHPFSVGDWINLPERGLEGHVEDIGWYMTRIRTFEKRPIYVPNSTFSKTVVMTPSRMSHRQFKETFRVRYSDIKVIKEIVSGISEMLREHPNIDQDQKTLV